MAAITLTPTSFRTGGQLGLVRIAGEDISAGQALYRKASDGKEYVADSSTAAKADVEGFAAESAAAGQPVGVIRSGIITAQATAFVGVTRGEPLFLMGSGNAGKLGPIADVAAGQYVTVLGWPTAAGEFNLALHATDLTKSTL